VWFSSYLLPHFVALLLLLEGNHFVDLEPELADFPRQLAGCFLQGHDLILRGRRRGGGRGRERGRKWRKFRVSGGGGGWKWDGEDFTLAFFTFLKSFVLWYVSTARATFFALAMFRWRSLLKSLASHACDKEEKERRR
jgi:hypothetical protein